MGLYKRQGTTGATWCIQYFVNGKRVREAIGPSKRQAELVLGKRKAAIREGKFFDVRKESDMSFSVLADRYLKEYAQDHKKPRSYQRNVTSTKVLKAFFGETPIKTISPENVDAFVQERKGQKKAPATINVEIALLSHMFTWANKRTLTHNHPVKGRERLATPCKERYLSHEEIQQLLSAGTGDLRDMVTLALGTGMRASEVLGLDRDHVDLKRTVAMLPDTKNGDRRLVPLPPLVIEMLTHRPAPLRELFPGWNLSRLEHQFPQAVQQAGLAGVTFHTLRHTFASYAVMAGVDLYPLAKLLGHRTISMVQRYAPLAPAHLQAATTQAAAAIFAGDVPREVPHASQQVA